MDDLVKHAFVYAKTFECRVQIVGMSGYKMKADTFIPALIKIVHDERVDLVIEQYRVIKVYIDMAIVQILFVSFSVFSIIVTFCGHLYRRIDTVIYHIFFRVISVVRF